MTMDDNKKITMEFDFAPFEKVVTDILLQEVKYHVYASRYNINKGIDSDLACLKDAMNQNSTVLVGRGYECNSAENNFCGMDNFYIFGTCLSILSKIRKNFCLG